jgi:carboxypeptidase D
MLSHPTLLDLKVQAMWLGSRTFVQYFVCCSIALMMCTAALAADVVADQAPAVNFVHKNLNVFPFKSFQFVLNLHIAVSHPAFISQSFLAQLDQIADKCNYNSFLEKYLTYPPPPAPFSLPGKSAEADPGCDVYTQIIEAVLLLNPAFNEYRIFDMVCCLLPVISLSDDARITLAPNPLGRSRLSVSHGPITGQHELFLRSDTPCA